MRAIGGKPWMRPSAVLVVAIGIVFAACAVIAGADDATPIRIDENNCALDQGGGCVGVTSEAEAPEVLAPDTFIFPATGDTRFNLSGTNFWNQGDYIEGSRTFTVPTQSMDMVLVVSPNVLSCDTQDMDVIVDGVTIGSFVVSAGDTQVVANFTFAQIAAGVHTLRIETTRTVNPGCGSAGYPDDVSTFDFIGVPVELMSFTIE
jgi:hypothetical protein